MKFVSTPLTSHMADRLHMWYFGQTIVIVEGLVGKTKHYACYKNSHIFLDLVLKFEIVKCQPSKSSRSTHKPWPRQKAKFQIWKRFMVGW